MEGKEPDRSKELRLQDSEPGNELVVSELSEDLSESDNQPTANDSMELEASEDSTSESNTTHSENNDELIDEASYDDSSDDNLGDVTSSSLETNRDQEDEGFLAALEKPKPKHTWHAIKSLVQRNNGISNHLSMINTFNSKVYGSLRFVQRMELAYKMDHHNGCVNALHFNSSGSRLASGSDDLSIIVWNWSKAEPVINYDSGHRGNVFQAKFLPLTGDMHIVSCARDGHVRIAELSDSGLCHSTRRLGLHRGPAHKLTLLYDTPHVFLTCGEDAAVLEIDVRQSKPNRLLTVKQGERKIALYSIASHPIDTNEFCLGGRDQFVRIYDRRRIGAETDTPLKKLCPSHLLDSSVRAHVTSALYNYNGAELLASYNDEDIYSFEMKSADATTFSHRYRGHRNNATVKGVNYYGPQSDFVVSGSDCGNIFFWDTKTEAIVQMVNGDENGVVNCLEPHPTVPVLATSGLDDDVKIWMPTNFEEPLLAELHNTVKTNHREREEERRREPDTIDGEMLWILWRHIRRTERRRRQQQQSQQQPAPARRGDNPDLSSSSEESEESESDDAPRGVQCAPS